MANKRRIVLLTHGGWGLALTRGIEMILGPVDFVREIPLTPSATFAEYLDHVESYVSGLSPDSLIMTDMLGGTPSNVAAVVGNRLGIRVFCGLCAPMLITACAQMQAGEPLDYDEILSAGQGACRDVVATAREHMTT